MGRYYKSWNDFEITKRELIASVSIIAIMLLVGVFITGKISEYQMDKNEKYNKAIHITDSNLFQYGIATNVGNTFIYGDFNAIDTVSYPEIGGEYMRVKKDKEKYTMHTRTVRHGKKTTVETYWTWDHVSSESIQCNKVTFCGLEFESNKFNIPTGDYIDTIKESSHVRYIYYGYTVESKGTIFAYLNKGNSLGEEKVNFYKDKDIEQTLDGLETDFEIIIFWIIWAILIISCVWGFYYLDNDWLN